MASDIPRFLSIFNAELLLHFYKRLLNCFSKTDTNLFVVYLSIQKKEKKITCTVTIGASISKKHNIFSNHLWLYKTKLKTIIVD